MWFVQTANEINKAAAKNSRKTNSCIAEAADFVKYLKKNPLVSANKNQGNKSTSTHQILPK